VISDTKTGKAYSKKVEEPVFLNKKIGDKVNLSVIGLDGFEGEIRGGSDKNGFPMKPSMQGTTRRKIFISKGVGFKPKRKGVRVRKTVRRNTVAEDIHQVNIAVTKFGSKSLEELLGKKEEKKEDEKESNSGKKE